LPSNESDLAVNTPVYAVGWGSVQNYSTLKGIYNAVLPNILQNVKMSTLSEIYCNSSGYDGEEISTLLQICAG
jgi:hypothetical protein